MTRAVVFAYHDVGVRCLSVLLAHGVDVGLVVTHQDNPNENIWFQSVAALARLHGIPIVTPDDPNSDALLQQVRSLAPRFLFSFYYRSMLGPALLSLVEGRAYNMHGSLLPQYRGRVPVNWAIINGERHTGATLHEMVEKPDAGRIVDQQAVPILPNDLAVDVFRKVTTAAEIVLDRSLPALLAGTAVLRAQDLASGKYYGGRRPEDGRIDWTWDALRIHNLVRAVAPPYPGAYADVAGRRLEILQTYYRGTRGGRGSGPALRAQDGELLLTGADGVELMVLAARLDGVALTPENFTRVAGGDRLSFARIEQ
ncbi:MAG: formyltransferase [Rhodospirillaceae bacterium]